MPKGVLGTRSMTRPLHLLAVWNPAYSGDALDVDWRLLEVRSSIALDSWSALDPAPWGEGPHGRWRRRASQPSIVREGKQP